MLKVLVTILAATVVAVPAASAAKPAPSPLSPDATKAAAAAVAAPTTPTVRRISPQEALAAASLPGAVTEVAPGLSAAQAVGLAAPPQRRLSRATASLWCWTGSVSQGWGIWPDDLWVRDYTDWCAYYGGQITYRSTHVTTDTTICSSQGTYTYRLTGGAGYTFVAWEDGGYFTCPTNVPWISFHFTHSMDLEANSTGSYFIYAVS